jgi:aryl-alcohol dehydrogenase-like predicted oxidoreductase
MERRRLGASDLEVSRLSLGSWRTFERISREDGLAVMQAAREHGINFLDDARYNDETGSAPIPTGYSEVLFGELFRAAGWDRDDTIVSNKLWWEFWPDQGADEELAGSLGRMQFAHVDLIYANPPPPGLPVAEMVTEVGGLLKSGKARAWAIVNWEAELFSEAIAAAADQGLPAPCAAQLPYSLVQRGWLESPEMYTALSQSSAGVVASFVMAGGVLTGKYDAGQTGRAASDLFNPRFAEAREKGLTLHNLANELGVSASALAIAFALGNPAVTSVLFGATSPEQIAENIRALEIDEATVQQLHSD